MIKIILLFFIHLLKDFFRFISNRLLNEKININNTTCFISKSSIINNSNLGKYISIFDNAVILNSCINDYTFIQKYTHVYNAQIGKFCSIGPYVTIAPGKHKVTGISTYPAFYQKESNLQVSFTTKDSFEVSKRVIIGNDVWIGKNVIIMDGINIGTGAIIGAGSIVTKNVNPYEIVGGVPAKNIRYRFSMENVNLLINSNWWNN